MLSPSVREVAVYLLQALAMGAFCLALFGAGLRFRDGELAALVVGPALITPTLYLVRARRRR